LKQTLVRDTDYRLRVASLQDRSQESEKDSIEYRVYSEEKEEKEKKNSR
jgi:hypothetical protein